MKKLWNWFWNSEPAVAMQIPTVVFAAAAGIWDNEWLAFAAAATAAVGAIVSRSRVSPVGKEE